jgi:hypothetical protein
MEGIIHGTVNENGTKEAVATLYPVKKMIKLK